MTVLVAYVVVGTVTAFLIRRVAFPDVGKPTTHHTTLLAEEMDADELSQVRRHHGVKEAETVRAVVVRETKGRKEHLLVTDQRVHVGWRKKDRTFRFEDVAGWSRPEHTRLIGEYRLKRRKDPAHYWFTFEVAGLENRRLLDSVLRPELVRHNRR